MLRRSNRTTWWSLSILFILAGAWQLAGCGSSGPPSGEQGSLSGSDLDQAQRLYAQLKREQSLNRDRASLEIAGNLLDYYPAFARNDEVISMAIVSSLRLDDPQGALAYTDEMLKDHPDSPLMDKVLLQGSEIAAAERDTLNAARYAVIYHDRDPERALMSDGRPRASRYLDELDPQQLESLMAAMPGSDLIAYMGYVRVRGLMEQGLFVEAEEQTIVLEDLDPEDTWTYAARGLVGGEGFGMAYRRRLPSGPVRPDQIGVLCPLSGRYAVLGNAYYEAALLALEAVNLEYETSYVLKVEDTAADPVIGAVAARRLCEEEGSLAIVGALMSAPTASAAVVADIYGVPMVSPTATNDRIWELGDRIYQTNVTGMYEVRVLAQLAKIVMLKDRFGILYPDDPEGSRHADVFRAEIEEMGGTIVAEAAFSEDSTDFRRQIIELREKRPEVLFVPASVDQMVLLGPQLDFYRSGSLVLGLSNWDRDKLVERVGTVLDRAIFPDDLALYPPQWADDFHRAWNAENYPREATVLALKAYQGVRMLLDTAASSGAVDHVQMTRALKSRLANREFDAEGPDSFAAVVKMFQSEEIVPFPTAIFNEGWARTEGQAVPDSVITSEELGGAILGERPVSD